jgi:beta-phosphoglucomutase-like phosphatase (HAD superfamily)
MASPGTDQGRQEAFLALAQALGHAFDVLQRSDMSEASSVGGAQHAAFHDLANEYIKDTNRQRRAMVTLYLAGLLAIGLSVAVTLWAAVTAASAGDFVENFLGRASVVVVLLLAALAAIWQADRHRRAAAEQLRLAHQLRTLPVFMESVDNVSLKDLLRGAVAPRFFPRALDDEDVLREPQWPNPDQVLEALNKGKAKSG